MAKFFFKMSKHTFRLILHSIEITIALIIVLSGLFFWRLSVAPMNVDFLVPKLKEHFVPKDLPITIDVNSIVLSASIQDTGLFHLNIKDLTVLRSDGSVVIDLPDIELSYGLGKVLTLNYMPDSLVIKEAYLGAILDKEGNLYLQSKDDEQAPDEIQSTPVKVSDYEGVIKYLMQFRQLILDNAKVVIDNQRQQRQYSIPRLDLVLAQEGNNEHTIGIDADVSAGNNTMHLIAHALFNGQTRLMPFEINFDSLNVSRLGRFISALNEAKIDIKGDILGTLDLTKSNKNIRNIVNELSFKFETQHSGTVNLPAPLTNEYVVDNMLIQGVFSPNLETLTIDKSFLKSGQVDASLAVDIKGIGTFLDTKDLSQITTVLKSTVKNVKTEQVPALWPSALGTDAHTWVKENLSEGGLSTADFTLYFTGAELVDLFGDIKASGVRVDYLSPMKAAENVTATVHLYPDKVDIFATSGHVGNINLKKADLHFTDLKSQVSKASMNIQGSGPVDEVMTLIDSKPLEFAQSFGLDPAQTNGTGDVTVDLNFPLVGDLDISDVQVNVDATIQNGQFPTPIAGENITNGQFSLTVNNDRLKLDGTAQLRQIPLQLIWTENFKKTKTQTVQSEYNISGSVSDEQLKPFYEDITSYMTGNVPITANIKKNFSGQTDITANLDLTNATAVLYPIAVTKDANVSASAQIHTSMQGNKSPTSIDFSLKAPKIPIDIKGLADWSDGIKIHLDKVQAPRNQFSGKVDIRSTGDSDIVLTGESWNMSELFDMPIFKKAPPQTNETGEQKEQIANVQIAPPAIKLNVDLKTLIFNVQKPLKFVQISGERQGYRWRHLNISASGRVPLEINYIPQTQELKGECDDLGDFLARVDATNRFFGGKMRLNAKQNKAGSFVGDITVRQFNLKDPGFIIQAVTVLGIVDGIRGKELNFKTAKIPFELTPYQNVYINEGYANGTSIGLTVKGRASLSVLSLSGQVIPAYAINSLPGKIPLIGRLFKDGAGGGLMGVRYELKGTPFNPEVQFNALSSIAPGALGMFFE